jgi:hypothetical protein
VGIVEEREQRRLKLLRALFDATDGRTSAVVNVWEIGESVGLTRSETDEAFEWLDDKDLAEPVTFGGGVQLTRAGVERIEEALRHPDQGTPGMAPVSQMITIHGDVHGSVQQAAAGSQQEAATVGGSRDSEDGRPWWRNPSVIAAAVGAVGLIAAAVVTALLAKGDGGESKPEVIASYSIECDPGPVTPGETFSITYDIDLSGDDVVNWGLGASLTGDQGEPQDDTANDKRVDLAPGTRGRYTRDFRVARSSHPGRYTLETAIWPGEFGVGTPKASGEACPVDVGTP